MSWNNIKKYIYTESRSVESGIYMWIDQIIIYKIFEKGFENEVVKEIMDTIKDMLQIRYDNSIKFQKIANPTFEEEKN